MILETSLEPFKGPQIDDKWTKSMTDENTVDMAETANSNNDDDSNDFGEFNGGSLVPSVDTSTINSTLIDSFAPEKLPSPKSETDIFSNLADFAMTGEPVPSDNFGTNAPNSEIAEPPGLHSTAFLLVWQKQICHFFHPWIAAGVLKVSCQIWLVI